MPNKDNFFCKSGSFYACDYGSGFIGCCADNNVERVCEQGCEFINVEPSYFDVRFFQYMNDAPDAICEKGYQWNVCPDPSENLWAFFGCYLTNETPCDLDEFSPSYVGNATTRPALDEGGPDPSTVESLPAAASTSISSSSTASAVSSTLGSTASHAHSASASPTTTHVPSKAAIGAIAGGFTGGLVATAALLAFALFYFRRRKTRQTKSPSPNSEPTIEESIPLTPAPAYTTSNEKPIPFHPEQPQPDTVFMREIGIPDSPPRPISELSSLEQGNAARGATATAAMIGNTGFIPYPAKRNQGQGQETPLTNASGNFPHAIPGIHGVGGAV